jgi:hypothetical protein
LLSGKVGQLCLLLLKRPIHFFLATRGATGPDEYRADHDENDAKEEQQKTENPQNDEDDPDDYSRRPCHEIGKRLPDDNVTENCSLPPVWSRREKTAPGKPGAGRG